LTKRLATVALCLGRGGREGREGEEGEEEEGEGEEEEAALNDPGVGVASPLSRITCVLAQFC
jgi:hypothetical protein